MKAVETGVRIALKNILFLTDFSEPSREALPFAVAIAREFGATVQALHILIPSPYVYTAPETTIAAIEAEEENALEEMKRVEAELTGVPHQTTVVRGGSVWPALQEALHECGADMIVLGTHGRTGMQKLLLGSVAEEIFRRSPVPVLTIGPCAGHGIHNAAHFHRILFATDFTPESLAATPYAISFAQENQARLTLLHVIRDHDVETKHPTSGLAASEAVQRLEELVPKDAELWCRPEAVVEHGEPAARIIEAAKERDADLIVMGVRNEAGRLGAAIHLERAVAHKVVAHVTCPVLTVRG